MITITRESEDKLVKEEWKFGINEIREKIFLRYYNLYSRPTRRHKYQIKRYSGFGVDRRRFEYFPPEEIPWDTKLEQEVKDEVLRTFEVVWDY